MDQYNGFGHEWITGNQRHGAPQDPHSKHYVHQNQAELHQPKHEMDKKLDPSRDWRIGHTLPRQYQSSRYQVDYRSHKHLAQAQTWSAMVSVEWTLCSRLST
jgi:Ni/Co efflux regulator RcnB